MLGLRRATTRPNTGDELRARYIFTALFFRVCVSAPKCAECRQPTKEDRHKNHAPMTGMIMITTAAAAVPCFTYRNRVVVWYAMSALHNQLLCMQTAGRYGRLR